MTRDLFRSAMMDSVVSATMDSNSAVAIGGGATG